MLRRWAAETPDAPMLTVGDVTLTWARALRAGRTGESAAGLGRRRRSVTGSPSSTATASSTSRSSSAAPCMGAVSVAVNWRLAPAEMAAIVDDAGAPVLFYGPEFAAAAKEMAPRHGLASASWVPLGRSRRVA